MPLPPSEVDVDAAPLSPDEVDVGGAETTSATPQEDGAEMTSAALGVLGATLQDEQQAAGDGEGDGSPNVDGV